MMSWSLQIRLPQITSKTTSTPVFHRCALTTYIGRFRADVARDCASGNDGAGRAIWNYQNVTAGTPNSTGYSEAS